MSTIESVNHTETSQAVSRYCLRCHHNLRGLCGEALRCPECGRGFDVADSRTFLKSPQGHIARHFAGIAQVMIVWSLIVTIGAALLSARGINPLISIVLGGILMVPGLFVVPLLVAIPCIPLTPRVRIAGALIGLCFLSIVYFQWPLRITFALHKSGFEAYAREIEALRIDPFYPTVVKKQPRQIGIFRVDRVIVIDNRNIGFQLGKGDALIVKRSEGDQRARPWYNTMWSSDLGGRWNYVCID